MFKDLLLLVLLIISNIGQSNMARLPSSDVIVPYFINGTVTCYNKAPHNVEVKLETETRNVLATARTFSNGSYELKTNVSKSQQNQNPKLYFYHDCDKTDSYQPRKKIYSFDFGRSCTIPGGLLLECLLKNVELSGKSDEYQPSGLETWSV